MTETSSWEFTMYKEFYIRNWLRQYLVQSSHFKDKEIVWGPERLNDRPKSLNQSGGGEGGGRTRTYCTESRSGAISSPSFSNILVAISLSLPPSRLMHTMPAVHTAKGIQSDQYDFGYFGMRLSTAINHQKRDKLRLTNRDLRNCKKGRNDF